MLRLFNFFSKKTEFKNNSNFMVIDKDFIKYSKRLIEQTKSSNFKVAIVSNRADELQNIFKIENVSIIFIDSSPYTTISEIKEQFTENMAGGKNKKTEGLLIFDYDTFLKNYNRNSIVNTLLMSKPTNMNCIVFTKSENKNIEPRTVKRIDYFICSSETNFTFIENIEFPNKKQNIVISKKGNDYTVEELKS